MLGKSPSLKVSNLRKSYGRKSPNALRGVSFEAYPGEVFGLLGPNGAGKTTVLRIIAGLILNYTGDVEVEGREYAPGSPPPDGLVGGLVDAPGFLPYLTGHQNLSLLAMLRGGTYDIDAFAQRAGIVDYMHTPYGSYSHGMRQRTGVAAALLCDSPVIILDEPLDGLDPIAQLEVRSMTTQLAEDGKTVILSSHRLSDVERVCSRLALLNRGETVMEGTLDELLRGGGFVVRVRDEDTVTAIRALRDAGLRVEDRGDGRLFLPADEVIESGSLLTTMISHGVEVLEFATYRQGLEELFSSYISNGEDPVA